MAERPPATIRVVTMNVMAPENGAWPQRRPVLAHGLRSLAPDIVALQEVVHNESQDAVTELLGHGWHIARNTPQTPTGVGTALTSRWPITQQSELDSHVTDRAASFSPWCTGHRGDTRSLLAQAAAGGPPQAELAL